MNKYKQSLLKNVKIQLNTWFMEQGQVPQIELYRFLHSISWTPAEKVQ